MFIPGASRQHVSNKCLMVKSGLQEAVSIWAPIVPSYLWVEDHGLRAFNRAAIKSVNTGKI